jgi:hypothetical protein
LKENSIRVLSTTLQLLLITMEIFLANNKKGIFPEWEILMSQAIIWKEKVDILYLKLNLEILELIFAMVGIILCIGWALG